MSFRGSASDRGSDSGISTLAAATLRFETAWRHRRPRFRAALGTTLESARNDRPERVLRCAQDDRRGLARLRPAGARRGGRALPVRLDGARLVQERVRVEPLPADGAAARVAPRELRRRLDD